VLQINETDSAVTIKVRAQPRASRTEIIGEHDGALKIRIAAQPLNGKANDECRRFLAKLLDVSATSVEIISGETSRDKIVRIQNISARRVLEALGR
jgi:uncharacterized protein (TIGR00251 family)